MTYQRRLLCGAAVAAALIAAPAMAQDQVASIDIAAQPMASALKELARQSGANVLFAPEAVKGLRAPQVQTSATPEQAARLMLAGTDLSVVKDPTGSLVIRSFAQNPQGGSAAGDGATVEALIVTAQKREEDIQDVPIAISAFSAEALNELKIEGGFDLLKAIPNVTFSKNNFTSYNFSIRGVGTKAISATTDPGVAVAFNSTGLIQNRLFEQEYFDIERVEVLRGPQGTLYGRNATSGVINVISAKPDLDDFDGWIKGEVGNFHTKRLSAMVNIPLVEDKLAIRLAGALTDRQGYDFNEGTGNAVNGRDLWSARLTIGFEPTERLRGNFIWERFNEDDDRSRTGKQLCHRDPGLTEINGLILKDTYGDPTAPTAIMREALFSQGCKPVNLYDDAAFDTPNGLTLPFVFSMLMLGGDCGASCTALFNIGLDENGRPSAPIAVADPYGGRKQSRDLRVIDSIRDPIYRAKADVFELNFDFDVTDGLTVTSQTAYVKDEVYSFQDFNRFNTDDVFIDTSQLKDPNNPTMPSPWRDLAPGGVFCDPQLGCSKKIAGFDISSADAEQFSQEIRLQSDFDGPFNFNFGANYTKFETLIDYYVFYNLITVQALIEPFYRPINGEIDFTVCHVSGYLTSSAPGGPTYAGAPNAGCPYIDPNPIESLNGEGHNYFRSKNPYELESSAGFGELYYNISDALKVTAGLRYTDDRKTFIPVPSQVLLAHGILAGGTVSRGYPEREPIVQNWGEWTGRLGVDWKPDLSFTDDSMIYAFFSRGYKGGGANPPSPGFATLEEAIPAVRASLVDLGLPPEAIDTEEEIMALIQPEIDAGRIPSLKLTAVEYGPTFEPEFVNAFEVGAKNTLLGGAMTLNVTGFYYDYKDYQVSQIRDRTAVNENFDATVWGLELETMFSPSRDLQIVANLGYLDTEIADGETSIDIMDRTAGVPGYLVVKPWVQLPSNCVVPVADAVAWLETNITNFQFQEVCGGWLSNSVVDWDAHPELNGGAGIRKELGGKELPNAPHWTTNIGVRYGMDILEGWRATIRGDVYWQSQSWHRVYNFDPYDKLHGWYNANLTVTLERPDDGLRIELYAKNILDDTPITDAFLNSDDTALTTNVFVLDPRLIGLSIRKEF